MNAYKKNFSEIEWDNISEGLKIKQLEFNNVKLRLAEFDDKFSEIDWCTKGHFGYVLDGNCTVIYKNGSEILYSTGDIITIPSGENNKHKALLNKGEKIKILFFNKIS